TAEGKIRQVSNRDAIQEEQRVGVRGNPAVLGDLRREARDERQGHVARVNRIECVNRRQCRENLKRVVGLPLVFEGEEKLIPHGRKGSVLYACSIRSAGYLRATI